MATRALKRLQEEETAESSLKAMISEIIQSQNTHFTQVNDKLDNLFQTVSAVQKDFAGLKASLEHTQT